MRIKIIFFFLFTQSVLANDLPIHLSRSLSNTLSSSEKTTILVTVLDEVAKLLPTKLKLGLPKNIEITADQLSGDESIPLDICSPKTQTVDKNKQDRPFVYGEYNSHKNLLVLNSAVIKELLKGRQNSLNINCQHKNLYDQSISTLVHELVHAYDFNNHNPSSQIDFIRRAGFKKGLLKTKTKNSEAMRLADPYELANIAEAYAVNLEYFTMDPEYACRRPAMFEYFKKSFEIDPYPSRDCQLNTTVMMSTPVGFYPTKLDIARVYRIDYLLASAGKDLSSGFGHSMFRVVMCAPERFDPLTKKIIAATPYGPKCLEDKFFHLVISYRANIEDATLNYLKGFFGGYPSKLFILSFGDVLDEYNRDELRDVISYPLALSSRDKTDFINKVLEEHWNYRGSYKFITNNCAVESFDLLQSAIESSKFENTFSVSPNGVLDDLDHLEFLSLKTGTQEFFKAQTTELISALSIAYDYKSSEVFKNKTALLKFVANSRLVDRLESYIKFSQENIKSEDFHAEISTLKGRLVKSSSYSVLEQQILRAKTAEFRKKAADFFTNSKDERIKKILSDSNLAMKQSLSDFAISGYGVPLTSELLINLHDINSKIERSSEVLINIQNVLAEIMPTEIKLLNGITNNINIFNKSTLGIRKKYRQRLEIYIQQVLVNLSNEDTGRELLQLALSNNESLSRVRELLDKKIVSENEILDIKLRKLVAEILN
ncbi:MAG: DUF4105 domain-containing protein [Bacteriovorax sp.]|nr:DUF4105 domain-containing protein [Bacteriovorax sp.]